MAKERQYCWSGSLFERRYEIVALSITREQENTRYIPGSMVSILGTLIDVFWLLYLLSVLELSLERGALQTLDILRVFRKLNWNPNDIRRAEYLFVMLAKLMSFSQLPSVKKTSFWQAWQKNIRPFVFCHSFNTNNAFCLKGYARNDKY